jgi:outer membrane lipoprotein-sorting protein
VWVQRGIAKAQAMNPIKLFFTTAAAAALVFGSLALSATLAFAQAPQAGQASAAALDQAVAALRGISTLTADFSQADRNGQVLRGKLTLKRPGRIRFEYEKSVNMLIVGDGRSLTMVDYAVNQVQRWPIRNSPLGALLDPSRDVKRFGTLRPTGNPDVISVEVRDPKHPEYGIITLIFVRNPAAPGGLELANWVALDSQNQRTTIRLSNHRYGMAVADRVFTWRDPRPKVRR